MNKQYDIQFKLDGSLTVGNMKGTWKVMEVKKIEMNFNRTEYAVEFNDDSVEALITFPPFNPPAIMRIKGEVA